jgi:ABC-2 type transport system permease protein
VTPEPSEWTRQLRIGLGLTRYVLRAVFRNKAGYFFSLIFPLTFVVVFGLFSNARPRLEIGVAESLDPASPVARVLAGVAQSTPGIRLVRAPEADLRRRLRLGRIAGIIGPGPAAGAGQTVSLTTSEGSPQAQAAAAGFVRSVVGEMNLRAAGIAAGPFQVQAVAQESIRHIDFILPGQIGFSMLSLATFGIAFNLATLRKTLVLKRMFATAVRPLTFLAAQGVGRSVQALFQTALILAVGVSFFHYGLARGWVTAVEMLVLAWFGILSFIGFGILLANLTDDDHSLPVVLNLFNLPQVILTGVFFPTDALPGWLRAIGDNLPLAYLNNALRQCAIEGAGLPTLWPYLLGMLGWAVAAYLLAARTFRAE